MKSKVTSVIVLSLCLLSSPLAAESWTDAIWDWFSGLFGQQESTYAPRYSERQLDSLRHTPVGANVLEVPLSDTLPVGANWPHPTVDVARTLERHNRMLAQTVLLRNPGDQLPYFGVPAVRVIYRYDQRPDQFLRLARRFADVQEVAFDESVLPLLAVAPELPTLILVDDPPNQSPYNADWYRALYSPTEETTLIHFGNPAMVTDLRRGWALINAPMRTPETESITAQAIFGAQTVDGRLATATELFPVGAGERLNAVRDGFRMPEEVGIDRLALDRVNYQIERAVRYRATPGAQLAIFKDGHLVYERAYGHHQYRSQAVDAGDLYDLASVTKAAATTLAVMKLYDQDRLDLEATVGDYLPEYANSIVGRYKIEHLLAHHTGLQSDLPVYSYLGRQYVADAPRDSFLLPLAQNRWLDLGVPNKIRGELGGYLRYTKRLKYQYSDVNYVLLQYVVEAIAEEPLDVLVGREFYEPLGLQKMTFRPHERYPIAQTVPTARDTWMRSGIVRGYVHDEGAALMGGVAGHAGLFANAHDLGRLFQLLLDGGEFAGEQLLQPETIARFTRKNAYNYRMLGFDRLAGGWRSVVKAGASPNTFGHLGFSGTAVWADPQNDLVFVLLSNRIHPNPQNERFNKMYVRGRTHRAVYRALDSWGMAL